MVSTQDFHPIGILYIKKRLSMKIHSQQLLKELLNRSFLFTELTSEMGFTRNTIFCLAVLLFCSGCVLSRPVEKRQTTQDLDQEPLPQENDDMLKFAILSRSSGKYLTMLKNGSVFASGLPVHGILDSSSLWYIHMTRDVYRLENVQRRGHYLSVAHRNNVTILVAQNLNKSFTLEMMMEEEMLSGDELTQNITQHNKNNSSVNSGSTFSFTLEWKIHSVDTLTSNLKLVRDDAECYLSFDHDGYPQKNLCSMPSMENYIDIVFRPIFRTL